MRSLALAVLTLALTLAAGGPATAAIVPEPGFGPSVFADEVVGPTRWQSELGPACVPSMPGWGVATFGTNNALTDSVGLNYAGGGCYTAIRLLQPIDLSSSSYCRVFFHMILQIVGSDHFVVQSTVDLAGQWQDERFYLPADNADAFRAESVRIARASGSNVFLRFLMHGFGTSTGDGVYLDDFDVRCDTIAPANPTLSSPSHILGVASSNPNIAVNLAGANDHNAVASGVAGYSYGLDANPATEPDYVRDADASLATLTLPAPPGAYYFHLRTQDGAGNWSAPFHLGPLVVKPVPALGLPAVRQTGRWAGSKYAGSVTLSLTATEPMSVDVRLRGKGLRTVHTYRCARRSNCAGQGRYAIPAGASRLQLKLPPGVQPGTFTISVTAAGVVPAAAKQFRIGAPRTGVLDSIYFSGRPNGSPAGRIPSHPTKAFLVYRFASRPRVGPLHVEFRVGGAKRPFEIPIALLADGRRDNRLIRDVPNLHGRWTAIMSVRGKVIGRATVVFP